MSDRSSSTSIPLWAKLHRQSDGSVETWHSLPDHSADVAAVLEALLRVPTVRDRLSRLAGDSVTRRTEARLAALAFLHDVGKANRGFRCRFHAGVQGEGHIQPLAWLLHGSGTEALLERLEEALRADSWSGWMADDAHPLLDAIFAHHGRPWRTEGIANCLHLWRPDADMDPLADLAVMGALPRLNCSPVSGCCLI